MQVGKESIATSTEEILLKGGCKLHRSFLLPSIKRKASYDFTT